MSASPAMEPARAYALWAATYDEENAFSILDQAAVRRLTPPLAGRDLLDAGCGTARRLAFATGAPRRAVGIDLVPAMLARGRRRGARLLAAGDLRALPVAPGRFDVVWCRLAAGHVAELPALYRELARAVRDGGHAVVTDFHPEAVRAGHRRTFRDAAGREVEVAHFAHEIAAHEEAAARTGLARERLLEMTVDETLRPLYERAGALSRWERDRGLPVLFALRFVARRASSSHPEMTSG